MKKIKLVVSDFHVGRGRLLPDGSLNILEDFIFDQRFIDFLNYYSSGDHAHADVELVLNGDFLNTVMVDYEEPYPESLTEGASQAKVRKIFAGHPDLFDALKKFAATSNHTLTYITGNHDPAVIWPSVRQLLRERLAAEMNFPGFNYSFDGVWVEHGCQHQAANRFDLGHLIIKPGDLSEPILNLPWGCFFLIDYLNPIKRLRPYADRVEPFGRYLFGSYLFDTGFALRATVRFGFFLLSHLFRRRKWKYTRFLNTLDILRQLSIKPKLERSAHKILRRGRYHTVIMGHNHEAGFRRFGRNRLYVNVGTWNDLILLDLPNLGRQQRTTFAYLEYEPGEMPRTQLKVWIGQHRVEEEMIF